MEKTIEDEEKVCQFCEGIGVVERGDLFKKCICKIQEEEGMEYDIANDR